MGTTERIELEWKYRCTARSLDSVPREVLDSSGIYVWIYTNAAASRVAYVGKSTGFSFKKRFREHFQALFGCGYAVYQINEEEDYLDFLATKVVDIRKVDDILTHENICWYQPRESPDYFKATFFENTEKRRRILDHYLAHLDFAFAPLPSSPSELVGRVEATLGGNIREAYVREVTRRYPHLAGKSFSGPGGRADDSLFVGRQSRKTDGTTIEIHHSVPGESVELQSLLKIMSPA